MRNPRLPNVAPPTILRASWLATMDGPVIRDGAVAMVGGRFIAVGPAGSVRAELPTAKLIDLGQAVLVPGLVNPHVHLELTGTPRPPDPKSFVDWLLAVMAAGPPPGDDGARRVTAATEAGIAQCLRFGVTTVGDITRHPGVTRQVLAESPLRAVSFGEVTAMAGRRALLEPRIAAALATSPAAERVSVGISPHAPYSIEVGGYERCVAAATDAGVAIATHLAESDDEAKFLALHAGPFRRLWDTIGGWDDRVPTFAGGPVRLAEQVGLLNRPAAALAHVNYADDAALARLAAGRASVVYCPRTHTYFGHPPNPWRKMLAMGINVAVGTDSTASSPDLNLVDDLRVLRRLAPQMPATELWRMATARAAAAIGLEEKVGRLAVGMAADVTAFPAETSDPLAAVLDGDATPIGVWIGGEHVTG